MPADSGPSSYTEYLNTLGELEGCNHSDNVDFDRSSSSFRSKLLCEFMSNLGLVSCDLSFRDDVKFTYECDNSLCRSWIDNIFMLSAFFFFSIRCTCNSFWLYFV